MTEDQRLVNPAIDRFLRYIEEATINHVQGPIKAVCGVGYASRLRQEIVSSGNLSEPAVGKTVPVKYPDNYLGDFMGVPVYVDADKPKQFLTMECQ